MRVVCVAGARPNFMKVNPVLAALRERGVDALLVHTGQHYDHEMSSVFFRDLGMPAPDHDLRVGSGSHAEQTARIMTAFEPLVDDLEPQLVVVAGDVNSTMACAIVAAKAGCLVAHVEAGLRSRDWSMPEEINRVVTDRVSDLLLPPSSDAVDNLRVEGYRDDQVYLVGNTMVDSLLATVERARAGSTLQRIGVKAGTYGLVTLHRPGNVDDPQVLAGLLSALVTVSHHIPLVFPAHPRVRPRLDRHALPASVRITGPLGYVDFLALQADAAVVLTDSGGVQEETTALGVPCLTLRDNTERPITVSEGTNIVVGRDPDRIVAETRQALERPVSRRRPHLWDGRAGERVADVVVATGGGVAVRPTGRPSATAMAGD